MHPGVDGGICATIIDLSHPMITFTSVTVLIFTFALLVYLGRDH
jgi:hypothetical protein